MSGFQHLTALLNFLFWYEYACFTTLTHLTWYHLLSIYFNSLLDFLPWAIQTNPVTDITTRANTFIIRNTFWTLAAQVTLTQFITDNKTANKQYMVRMNCMHELLHKRYKDSYFWIKNLFGSQGGSIDIHRTWIIIS